jgi:Domain of unknown function (DUF4384)
MSYLFACLVCLLIIFPDSGFAGPKPVWLQDFLEGTFHAPGYHVGVGFAEFKGKKTDQDVIELARHRALEDLSSRLSVSIHSKFKEYLDQKGSFAEENVNSSIFVSTRLVLSGVRPTKNWTDHDQRWYWVMVIIDKAKADQQVAQQKFIDEVVDRLERKQDEIRKGTKRITAVINQNMKVYAGRMKQFGALLKTIDNKVVAAGTQTKKEYAALEKQIQASEQRWKRLEEILQHQDKKMETLLQQNQELQNLLNKISKNIHNDYFLALAQEDLRNKNQNQDFGLHIIPAKGQGADYYEDQTIRFHVRAFKDCYIKVLYFSSLSGASADERRIVTLLFPNPHDTNNRLSAGETKVIGQKGELIVAPPYGKDVITVVASERQFSDIAQGLKLAQEPFRSEVTSNTRGAIQMLTRGIAVPAPAGGVSAKQAIPAAGTFSTDTCFIVSHPISAFQTEGNAKQKLVLFSDLEAPKLNLTDEQWRQFGLSLREFPLGPRIIIQRPAVQDQSANLTIDTFSPVDLMIAFEENRAPVDMRSLQVIAKKGFFSKSLTALLRPYIQGNFLEAKGVEIPSGRFRIRISIADQKGTKTEKEYRLRIKGK